MTGMPSSRPGDCMDCPAERVPCVWSMEPLFWRRCVPCHQGWEARHA